LYAVIRSSGFAIDEDCLLPQQAVDGGKGQIRQGFSENTVQPAAIIVLFRG
jgi:hypothetical protein